MTLCTVLAAPAFLPGLHGENDIGALRRTAIDRLKLTAVFSGDRDDDSCSDAEIELLRAIWGSSE